LAVLLAGALTAAMTDARAQSALAIRGGKILTVTEGVIENGTVVIENGRITAVGRDVRVPAGAEILDARGRVVMPGLMDSGTLLGLVEIPMETVTVDATEYTDPVQPDLRVWDALNPRSELIRVARAAGITHALSRPAAGNLIAGQSAVIQLDGETVGELIVKAPAALHVNLGEPSKQTYAPKDKPPATRMGQLALARQAFLKAQNYRLQRETWTRCRAEEERGAGKCADYGLTAPPGQDLKMQALLEALDGKIPVVVRAFSSGDIQAALRLAEEFKLRLILSGATSAWRLADELAAKKIPVIVGSIFEEPRRMELLDVRLDSAALLHRAGVTLAFQTDSENDVRNLPFEVGVAIGHGLPEDAALAAVTVNPARLFGLDDRLGSVEAGKTANLLVLDGMPFYTKTRVVTALINGRVVDLSNHQTRLFEAYKKKYGIE
jgi:imidazolonepropionase-like amidohydrolase